MEKCLSGNECPLGLDGCCFFINVLSDGKMWESGKCLECPTVTNLLFLD